MDVFFKIREREAKKKAFLQFEARLGIYTTDQC